MATESLMQQGIRQVKAGQTAEAYTIFKKVVSEEPDNEFAWIWVSVTTIDASEKRSALERALEINPDSQHARDALRALDVEVTTAPTTKMEVPVARSKTLSSRISSTERVTPAPVRIEEESDSLRAALTSDTKKKKAEKAVKPLATTQKVKPVGSGRGLNRTTLIVGILVGSLVLAALAIFILSQPGVVPPPDNTTPIAQVSSAATVVTDTVAVSPDTTEPVTSDATTPNPEMTVDVNTPALETVAVSVPPIETSEATVAVSPIPTTLAATTPTIVANTTAVVNATAAGSTPVANVTNGVSTPVVSATTPVANATNGTVPTAGAVTASPAAATSADAVALALQTARDSQLSGDYKSAIAAYQSVLQTDLRNVPANLGLANALLIAPTNGLPTGIDRYGEAVRALRLVTLQTPNWAGGYTRLAEAYTAQGSTKEAIEALTRSLELDANGPERWLVLASLYDKDSQPEQARYARERATGVNTLISPLASPSVTTTLTITTTVTPTLTPQR